MTTKRYAVTVTEHFRDGEPKHRENEIFTSTHGVVDELDTILGNADLVKVTLTILVGSGTTTTSPKEKKHE